MRVTRTILGMQKTNNSAAILSVMCGRFTLRTALNILLQEFHAELRDEVVLSPRSHAIESLDPEYVPANDVSIVTLEIGRFILNPRRSSTAPGAVSCSQIFIPPSLHRTA
jgi:hypothetical protein